MSDDPTSSGPPAARPFVAFAPMLRALGIASDAKKLILAVSGILLLWLGWSAIDLFLDEQSPPMIRPGTLFETKMDRGRLQGITNIDPTFQPDPTIDPISPDWIPALAWRVSEPVRLIVSPFLQLFGRATSATWLRSALMGLWAVVIWGVAGGAIARIAVVQAACGRRIGIGSAVRFALKKSGSLIGAPLIPFLAVACFVAVNASIGLVSRIPGGVGATVAAALGFVPILLAMVMALILIGLALGWPLMHATIAAEDEDAADALSRSYSYVNQRFVRYLLHVALAWGIGMAGLYLASQFAAVVVHLAGWSEGLGASSQSQLPRQARLLREGWGYLIQLLLHGWAYSFFWSSASIIYLILRRDVDGTEWEEVALPEHAADTFAPVVEPAPGASPIIL